MENLCSSTVTTNSPPPSPPEEEEEDDDEDRISYLPDEILHHILSFLPMRQAVGTSILSNKWKTLWTHNPNLDFSIEPNFLPCANDYIDSINHCIRLYNRPNLNRLLVALFTDQDFSSDFESWINFATQRGVRELCLRVCSGKSHLGLPDLLYCHTPMTDLALSFSVFDPPIGFRGFPFLKFLELFNVRMSENTVGDLISDCPLLEKLAILNCDEFVSLVISNSNVYLKMVEISGCERLEKLVVDSPNVVSIKYDGQTPILICLNNVSNLMEANVLFWASLEHEDVHAWAPLVTSLGNCISLMVRNWFTQYIFGDNCVMQMPHVRFVNLKEFHWNGDLASRYEILALATFLGDCPVLEKLSLFLEYKNLLNVVYGFDWYRHFYDLLKTWIPAFDGAIRKRTKKKDKKQFLQHLDYVLPHLKTIDIFGFSGTKREMDLLEFLLDKTPALDLLHLTVISEDDTEESVLSLQVREKLTLLPKASAHVKIVLTEPPPDLYDRYGNDQL